MDHSRPIFHFRGDTFIWRRQIFLLTVFLETCNYSRSQIMRMQRNIFEISWNVYLSFISNVHDSLLSKNSRIS